MDELDSPKSPLSLESSSGSQKRVSITPPTPSLTEIIRSFGGNSPLKGVNLFLNSQDLVRWVYFTEKRCYLLLMWVNSLVCIIWVTPPSGLGKLIRCDCVSWSDRWIHVTHLTELRLHVIPKASIPHTLLVLDLKKMLWQTLLSSSEPKAQVSFSDHNLSVVVVVVVVIVNFLQIVKT